MVAGGGGLPAAVVLGHFLRQLNIVLNPLAWSSAEIIFALLIFTIAASVLVRYYGTGNRVSLLLGLTFGVTGIIHLGAIFEFYDFPETPGAIPRSRLLDDRADASRSVASYRLRHRQMAAVAARPRKKCRRRFPRLWSAQLAWSRCIPDFSEYFLIRPHSPMPRVWELLPAVLFLVAAVVLNSVKESDGFAFDTALVWVAGLNAMSHLIASQSARLLDASAGGAELINATAISFCWAPRCWTMRDSSARSARSPSATA